MSDGFINLRSLMAPVYQTQDIPEDEYYRMLPNAYRPSWDNGEKTESIDDGYAEKIRKKLEENAK